MLINVSNSENASFRLSGALIKDAIYNFNSFLYNLNQNGKQSGFYYGENFNNFYISWRTGKIGLTTMDGRGFFQGTIDEEWLANNNYVKKTA